MTLARTTDLLADAVSRDSGLLAFNVITLEHAEGILAGAMSADRPVVLQISENAIRYHDGSAAPLLRACAELCGRSCRDRRAAPRPHHRRRRCWTIPSSKVRSASAR